MNADYKMLYVQVSFLNCIAAYSREFWNSWEYNARIILLFKYTFPVEYAVEIWAYVISTSWICEVISICCGCL